MTIFDSYTTLHPSSDDRALQQAFEGAIHDPVWFLARQWQMGEHQGENASTPLIAQFKLSQIPIRPSDKAPAQDPTQIPAEAIVESEPEDWWTMGRRVRLGNQLKTRLPNDVTRPRYLFRSPPSPYESFDGLPDGLALWRNRTVLGIAVGDFGPDVPPVNESFAWSANELHYDLGFPRPDEGLAVTKHHGGQVDWFSADSKGTPPQPAANATQHSVLPTPLEYPGAPASRFWQIEDAAVDIGGYPPDVAHFATMLLVDLIYSHSDDWFLLPVTARAGNIVFLSDIKVIDAFNLEYASTNPAYAKGLTPPTDWSLFHCQGLKDGQLVLWNVAEMPLESGLIEQVHIGTDEASNLVWAVERVVDGRDANSIPPPQAALAGQTPSIPSSAGNMTNPRTWRYEPSDPPQRFWHPYIRLNGNQFFVQRGLADLNQTPPKPMPRPESELLRDRKETGETIHSLASSSIPSNGISVERRWMLARDLNGKPILWIQRQRKPLLTPPARQLRFDIALETT